MRILSKQHSNLPGVNEAHQLLHELGSEQSLCIPRKVDKSLILYGAGRLGEMAKEFFGRLEIPFLYVVDANAHRHARGKSWQVITIVKPDDVPKKDRAQCLLAICIATAPFTTITAPLVAMGWRDIVPFYDITEAYSDRWPLSNGWFTDTLSPEDFDGIEYALAHWDDDISRAHHLQFLSWHSLRKELVFAGAPVTLDDRFFIPQVLVSLHDKEIFLDGGAHHGEVSLRFMDTVQNRFKKIYAFEPDRYNLQVLRTNLRNENGSLDIQIIDCALGKERGCAPFFHGLDYASQFSSLTQEAVPVVTLDEMDIPATIIKLHLEGWEYNALLGSINNLKKYRPILIVTTYHKQNGLWQLPVMVMKYLQDYKFLLRLHGWMGTGCVLYAIPQERYMH